MRSWGKTELWELFSPKAVIRVMYNKMDLSCDRYVTKCMCVPSTQAKHTETPRLGAKKGLLQGHTRRWVAHTPNPKLLEGFQQSIFKGQEGGGAGHRACDQRRHDSLIDGW